MSGRVSIPTYPPAERSVGSVSFSSSVGSRCNGMATRVTATVSILLETFLTHPRLTGITIGSWIVYANLLPPVFSPYIIAMPFVIALGRAWQLAGSVCETTPDTAYVSVHVEDPSQE